MEGRDVEGAKIAWWWRDNGAMAIYWWHDGSAVVVRR